ncbi:hemagglutinin repeat-containing protein (plasmid) [Komagataeibacter nataicola]|uniref:two-partner secretion domain-containing protein n=1 Tax=Komagataeibacter nataicola TaxID=265960 RepID=UPI0023DD4BB9|nr:hemagglutinin repeat-containing protein [Komagataeibacter nataicola]WEQ54259.1 hemagglutinin repeat-containing protein [Komagataeibacter nataicola]
MKTRRRAAVPDTIAGPTLFQRCVHVSAAASLFLASMVPMASAQQAEPQIVVDPHAGGPEPTLDKTQNGIDQVNIATPNAAGVSHNDFLEYGVPDTGVILNNATSATETKLGGEISGNANLNGHAASLILNEVTGSLPTEMLGTTEVAGHLASVVVANPNGITCAGCGFINTARVTLVTGRPELDANGSLKDFTVSNGNITFSGQGGDFTTVPVLDILSRSVTLNAKVNAQTANIVAGRNTVDYGTNATHPLTPDGSITPEFAIDTAALGGMYANRIYMVVNEAGAGVRVDGTMAANAGDMTLTDAGDLVLNGNMTATGNARLASGGTVTVSGTLQAAQDVSLSSQALTTTASGGVTATKGTLDVTTTTLDDDGTLTAAGPVTARVNGTGTGSGKVSSGGDLSVTAGGDLGGALQFASGGQVAMTVGGTYSSGADGGITAPGTIQINATGISNGGTIQSGQAISIASTALGNSGRIVAQGGDLTFTTATMDNDGTMASAGALAGQATTSATGTGVMLGSSGVSFTTAGDLGGAMRFVTGGAATLGVGGAYETSSGGGILAAGDVTVSAGSMDNAGAITSARKLAVTAASDVTNTGLLSGDDGVSITLPGTLANTDGTIQSRSGDVVINGPVPAVSSSGTDTSGTGDEAASATSGPSDETMAIPAATAAATSFVNQSGVIRAAGDVRVTADSITNDVSAGMSTVSTDTTSPSYLQQALIGAIGQENGAARFDSLTQLVSGQAGSGATASGYLFDTGVSTTLDGAAYLQARLAAEQAAAAAAAGTGSDPGDSAATGSTGGTNPATTTPPTTPAPPLLGNGAVDADYASSQVFSGTGQASIGTVTGTQEQALLNNAVTAAQTLGLTYGTALTSAQQAGLTQPILWYVPQSVDGQTVLAPHVYLPTVDQVSVTQGEIVGQDVTLTGNSVSNTGTVSARDELSVSAATGDITDTGVLVGRGGSPEQYEAVQGVLASGGATTLSAEDGISVRGGTITSGGDLSLTANGGIDLGALTSNSATSGDGTYASAMQNYGTTVTGKTDVTAIALGGNLSMEGSSLSAGGTATVMAAGDITLQATTDSQYSSNTSSYTTGFMGSTTITTTNTASASQQQGSDLSATGDLTVVADGSLSAQGSVRSARDAMVTVGGDVTLTATTDTSGWTYSRDKDGIFSGGDDNRSGSSFSNTPTLLAAVGNVSVTAGQPVSIWDLLFPPGQTLIAAPDPLTDLALLGTDTADYEFLQDESYDTQTLPQQVMGASGQIFTGGTAQVSAEEMRVLEENAYLASSRLGLTAGVALTAAQQARLQVPLVWPVTVTVNGQQVVQMQVYLPPGKVSLTNSGDITLDGSAVEAGGNVTLQATGNVALNAVTDSQSYYSHSVSHGLLNRTTITESESFTSQIGSTIAANGNVSIVAGKNMSVAGTIADGGNITLQAGGSITENALQSTAQSYYNKESKGLYFDTDGAKAHIGYGVSKETISDSSTTWNPSMIASTAGTLDIMANGPVAINASGVSAAKDLNVTGSSVSLNALSDVSSTKQTSDFKFIGVQVGLSDTSLVGQIANLALAAAQTASDKDMASQSVDALSDATTGVGIGENIAQLIDTDLSENPPDVAKLNIELVGVQAEVGFEDNHKTSETTSTTAQGSVAEAGNGLTITATGAEPATDRSVGNIVATAASLSGETVTLAAPGTLQLQSGQDTMHTITSQTALSAFVGATASLNANLQWGVSVTGQLSASHSHTDSQSVTQMDTTVSGAKNVTIDNGAGRTTLDGARVSGGSVDVMAGNLDITSAQNTANYLSTNESAGFSFAIPVYGTGGEKGFSVNASAGILYDTYASTEASGLSGLYAGQGGLDVDIAQNTTLNAGIMKSTAASGNTVTTGSLTAHDEQNISIYTGASASISYGNLGGGGNTGPANPKYSKLSGNSTPRKKFGEGTQLKKTGAFILDVDTSTSHSAIGQNITVDAGSVSGNLSRDPSTASHALGNGFNAGTAGEILSLTESAVTSAQAAYKDSKSVPKLINNATIPLSEKIKNAEKQ